MDDFHETSPHHERQPDISRRMWLGDLRPGTKAIVYRLCGGKWLAARVAAMGFTPGAEVVMLQNYGRGPVIVMVRGARVALGRGEARKIQVEV